MSCKAFITTFLPICNTTESRDCSQEQSASQVQGRVLLLLRWSFHHLFVYRIWFYTFSYFLTVITGQKEELQINIHVEF